jgi:hypothetical protein
VHGQQLAVRPEGADYQRRKIPPGELSIDPVADERSVRPSSAASPENAPYFLAQRQIIPNYAAAHSRAAAQDELWSRLNVKADEVKHGPAQLEPLAEWVRGIGTAEKLGLLVQQSVRRLFVETFTATEESWAAACMVLEAASSSSVTKMLGWRISGRLERAKTLLASMVNGDLAAVNAIIAAPQLIVDGLHKMRQLAADPALRSSITTDAAVDECLFAPTTVVRQAKTSGEVGGCFFRRGSLFILGLGSASKGAANRDLVFLSQSWSRCPAEKWVPALLEGVWTRVSATLHES